MQIDMMVVVKTKIICSVVGCFEEATDGTNIQKEGDPEIYIIPECAKHAAMKGMDLEIRDDITLVSARSLPTCGL